MKNDICRVLISEEQLKEKVTELGTQISRDYEGKKLLLVSILKGSVVFMADLMRAITIPARIIKDLDLNLEGYDVLIVEDILDSGMTLSYLVELLKSRNPASVEICSLLDKPERHKVEIALKYKGFTIPDEFVVGYGLDYSEKYRNLPYVGILDPKVYS